MFRILLKGITKRYICSHGHATSGMLYTGKTQQYVL